MDWFDKLLTETKNSTQGAWYIAVTSEGYNNIEADVDGKTFDICGDQGILHDGGEIDNANANLMCNAPKMRDEIIRLRKILGASEMINTHSSLDEK